MTTTYSLSDSLPKDAGGAKFAAWINLSTSQLDFSLPAGIGGRTVGSKIVSALQVGTNVAGSKIEPTGGVGVALMAHFASNASATATQNAIHLRGDDRGQVYISALSSVTTAVTGSTNTVTLASGILYKFLAAGCGVVAGAQMAVMNGATSLAHVVFSGANETIPIDFGTGACFSSLKYELRGSVGTAYATITYRAYGQ